MPGMPSQGFVWAYLTATNITTTSGNDFSAIGNTLYPVFDGGTLTNNSDATETANFSLTGNGGTLDAGGHVLVFTGLFSNVTSGTPGHLIIADSGVGGAIVLAPTAPNTFTGGTRVEAGATLGITNGYALGGGTLQLFGTPTTPAVLNVLNTTTISNPIEVEGDPTFNVASGTTTTISSVITDGASAGDVVLNDDGVSTGKLVLSAANTYTGATVIDAGTLALSGSGSIANSSGVTNNGTFDISAKTTPVSVAGLFTQGGTGTLVARLTPSLVPGSGYSQLRVNGATSIAGRLAVIPASGTYLIGSKYDLIHAEDGVSGRFSIVQPSASFGPYIDPTVMYQPNDVYLKLSPQPVLVDSGRAYVASRFAVNESLFQATNATLTDYDGFDQTSGSARRGAWIRILGSFGSANRFNFHTGGLVGGYGFQLTPRWCAGFGVQSINADTNGSYGTVHDSETGVTGYGIYRHHKVQLSFSETVGNLKTKFNRSVPEFNIQAQAGGSGLYDVSAVRAQYEWNPGRFFVTPAFEAAYVHTQTNAVSESGAGSLGLRYAALDTNVGRISGAVTGGMVVRRGFGAILSWLSVGGYGSVGSRHSDNTETLGLATSVQGANTAASAAYVGAVGVRVIGNGHWRGDVQWGGSWGDGTSTRELGLDVSYVW